MRTILALSLLLFAAVAGAAGAAAAAGEPPKPVPAPRLAGVFRMSGDVVVEALVDSSGAVRATNIVRSQPVLDDSASMFVTAQRFDPARDEAGRAIVGIRTVPVRFESAKAPDVEFSHYAVERCGLSQLAVELAPRPDSSGLLVANWSAKGPRASEFRLLVLTPDGVDVDGEEGTMAQRLLDADQAPGWPAWQRSGKQMRKGTSGTVSLHFSETSWWSSGRIAFVGLFRDAIGGGWMLRQQIYRVERDEMGALLVRDPTPAACLAGPDPPPGAIPGLRFEPVAPDHRSTPLRTDSPFDR